MRKAFIGTLGVIAVLMLLMAPAFAQKNYPTKAIDIIVPYSPGGGTDIMFRNIEKIITQYKLVSQPINIVNKGGGGGGIGKAFCLSKPADGYTLTCFDLGTVSQQIEGRAKWDFRKDFSYIARMVADINLLIVPVDSPYNTVKDLVEAVKKKGPNSISFGGTGTGGADTYATFDLSKVSRQQFNYVPFNSGGEVMTNLLGKHIDGAWANPNECVAQVEAKQVKIVGVATEKRSPLFPNHPTLAEQGFKVISNQTRSVVGKAGLPANVIDYWVAVLDKVRKTPEWKEYLKTSLLEDGWLAKGDFFKDAENDYNTTKAIIEEMGRAKK
ncbi:MAG TPA: tripartite tricarboxylate transporter substrate binding protein [Thermodesulfobacteriota bacterium]|nr:tripartite tricarboxylate transporter substrate binding protein [Thermodesulfobacteriota bacterium]